MKDKQLNVVSEGWNESGRIEEMFTTDGNGGKWVKGHFEKVIYPNSSSGRILWEIRKETDIRTLSLD